MTAQVEKSIMEDEAPKVWVECLASYNSGNSVGRWVNVPDTVEEMPLLEPQETRTLPSHTCKPVTYGSLRYNQLLRAKTILSLYGYKRDKYFFDVVTKDNFCFNIVSDEKGFYLKQTNNEASDEIY